MSSINWITKNLLQVGIDFLKDALDFFGEWIVTIFDDSIELMTSSEIAAAVMITKGIAVVLVLAMLFKHMWDVYVLEVDGDPDQDPMQIYVKAAISLALIEGNELIFTVLQEISKRFIKDLAGSISARDMISKMSGFSAVYKGTSGMLVFVLLVSLISLVIFSFLAGLRAGELALMRIVFPIMAVDKMGSNPERWKSFLTTYIVTFFGYALQLLCVKIGISRLIAGMGAGWKETFQYYFAGLVFFFLAIKTPKWLEKFVYSSGIGQMAANGARSAGFILPSLLRRG